MCASRIETAEGCKSTSIRPADGELPQDIDYSIPINVDSAAEMTSVASTPVVLRPKLSHEVCSIILRHATGYSPTLGFETEEGSPFGIRDKSDSEYRQIILDAQQPTANLRGVCRDWKEELDKHHLRHSLLIDGRCDWRKSITKFKDQLGRTVRRITFELGDIGRDLSRCVAEICETLTNVRIVSFSGRSRVLGLVDTSRYLEGEMTRMILRNTEHLSCITWTCVDIDILPIIPLCNALKKLTLNFSGVYEHNLLDLLKGALIRKLESLTVRFPSGDAMTSNIFTVFATWFFPALIFLTVDCFSPARDLRKFLATSGNGIEYLKLTETKSPTVVFTPLPVIPSLRQLEICVQASSDLLSTSQPNVTEISLMGFSHFIVRHCFLRLDNIRSLVRGTNRLARASRFPRLQIIHLHRFNVNTFNFIRWIPYEETAFGYVSRLLLNRHIAWLDGTRAGGDMHEAVKSCLVVLPGDSDYMASADSVAGDDDDHDDHD